MHEYFAQITMFMLELAAAVLLVLDVGFIVVHVYRRFAKQLVPPSGVVTRSRFTSLNLEVAAPPEQPCKDCPFRRSGLFLIKPP